MDTKSYFTLYEELITNVENYFIEDSDNDYVHFKSYRPSTINDQLEAAVNWLKAHEDYSYIDPADLQGVFESIIMDAIYGFLIYNSEKERLEKEDDERVKDYYSVEKADTLTTKSDGTSGQWKYGTGVINLPLIVPIGEVENIKPYDKDRFDFDDSYYKWFSRVYGSSERETYDDQS